MIRVNLMAEEEKKDPNPEVTPTNTTPMVDARTFTEQLKQAIEDLPDSKQGSVVYGTSYKEQKDSPVMKATVRSTQSEKNSTTSTTEEYTFASNSVADSKTGNSYAYTKSADGKLSGEEWHNDGSQWTKVKDIELSNQMKKDFSKHQKASNKAIKRQQNINRHKTIWIIHRREQPLSNRKSIFNNNQWIILTKQNNLYKWLY